ncbi:DMT family transporter [Brevibacillus laterosporus]|uniref:DMT family transporter n=1 Tax=Brevibacillus laterosporus TaxID=1465 RepID=A0AAP3GAF5_BRELA|nr:DMT family transporter [Brevibacillus laterosporus]MCR8982336.1 DMT family transporter [Brevibacillus laterosporus]MCZ0809491.1 DMT family transporter [Brevibacillus laterosporus]MCZ0827907.1 DMT family transporter [Brevibacillus laterosporus]MCZ0851805.1 DMT family transporter [Brevibacillus laterosporus]MED1666804.1 DMT family transporter [Brevibacillus laterosporus]
MGTQGIKINRIVYLIPLLATLLWGSNFLVGKNILHHVPPFTLGFLRWSFALIVLLPFTWKSLCENWEFYLKFWREILLMGFLGIALFTGLVYWGMEHTNTVNASLLSSLSPIFITIVAYFMLHERINSNQIIGILLSLLGVLWIVSKGHIGTFADIRLNNGDIVLILSNVLMAIYSVMLRKTADRLPGLIGFTLIVFAGVLTSVPLMMVEVSFRPVQLFLWENLWSIAYLGIFSSVIAFFCWTKTVHFLGPTKASPFMNLVPVFATMFAVLFLREELLFSQIVGGVLVLLGVYWSSRPKKSLVPISSTNPQVQELKY